MQPEPHSLTLINRFAIASNNQTPTTYYRSKLFNVSSTSNPLVAAAGPLFSLIERLCISPTLPPLDSMHDNIEHELQAYRCRLARLQYAEDAVVIAHYLLCATLDELLGKNHVRIYGEEAAFKAFTPSSHNDVGPEKCFFDIVHYIKERANQYLDLIELAYYCLIAGFEGEQHVRTDGRQTLDNLIEGLYLIIQQHRVNKPYRLFKEPSMAATPPNPKIHHKPLLIGSLAAVLTLAVVYMMSQVLINHQAKTMLFEQIQLAKQER